MLLITIDRIVVIRYTTIACLILRFIQLLIKIVPNNCVLNFYFSFEGLIFFVYDREAVTKEEDPPENAIVYFYPPSVIKLILF